MEIDDDKIANEYSCPFCGEDFDVLELCLHIDDEHPADVKAGVCNFFLRFRKFESGL